MIVDDEADCLEVLQSYLESQGYYVLTAPSAESALTLIEENPPDLIISDVAMPQMDGFEFCQKLRARRVGQLVPFIFLSAQSEITIRLEGYAIGADDYLIKPFHPDEIVAKIRAQLERSRRINSEIVRLLQNRQETPSQPTANPGVAAQPLELSPAEVRVFWEVIQGYTNKQISDRLFISPRTVQAHLSNIFQKLQVDNRSQLVRFALEQGYRPPSQQSEKS